ncbi:GFA family protein [Vibrio ostreicida]
MSVSKSENRGPDDFEYLGNGHCSECRQFTGSDYSSVGGINSADFRFISG